MSEAIEDGLYHGNADSAGRPTEIIMSEYRTERDSMGEVSVPADAYYGAQTQRAIANSSISGWTMPMSLIRALGLVKYAGAAANRDLDKLTGSAKRALTHQQMQALLDACREVADGRHDDQFPVDVFQTGSGTSTNMNVNEVIANRAIELSGGNRFAADKAIHPNDHVNMGQSSNDTFPTAIHIAVGCEIVNDLIPALEHLGESLAAKAKSWDHVVKIGRTHLMDATPLLLGQEFSGFARQLQLSVERARQAIDSVRELPIGGTAVGTGINTHPQFGQCVSSILANETGIAFIEARNHFEANATRDGLVSCHGQLRTIATTLFNVANNIRWLASGPRCGFNEIQLPSRQPGSSIMPGKVNPVMCESMMQVSARVLGNDQTVAFCGATGGQFQLNMMMPVMAHAALQSIQLLSAGIRVFDEFCVQEMTANAEACGAMVEQSLSMVTSLVPLIGYDKAAALARKAMQSGKSIYELCREEEILPVATLDEVLDPICMTEAQS